MTPTIEEIREWARRKRSDYLRALDLPVVLPFGVQDIVIIDALLSMLDEPKQGGVSEEERERLLNRIILWRAKAERGETEPLILKTSEESLLQIRALILGSRGGAVTEEEKGKGPKFKIVIEESKPGEPNLGDWIDKQYKADLRAAGVAGDEADDASKD